MTHKVEDGGSAFPAPANKLPGYFENQGMTLRDYFAGQSIAGQYGWVMDNDCEPVRVDADKMARAAYTIADAMLAARAPQSEDMGK